MIHQAAAAGIGVRPTPEYFEKGVRKGRGEQVGDAKEAIIGLVKRFLAKCAKGEKKEKPKKIRYGIYAT